MIVTHHNGEKTDTDLMNHLEAKIFERANELYELCRRNNRKMVIILEDGRFPESKTEQKSHLFWHCGSNSMTKAEGEVERKKLVSRVRDFLKFFLNGEVIISKPIE